MRTIIIIITTCILCASCGVKNEPKYEAQKNYNNISII